MLHTSIVRARVPSPAVDSIVLGEKRLHGSFIFWGKFIEKPTIDNAGNVASLLWFDVITGICIGYAIDYAVGGEAATASADVSTVADVGDALDVGGVDGAGAEGMENDAPTEVGEDLK